jgi:hypothetical protein
MKKIIFSTVLSILSIFQANAQQEIVRNFFTLGSDRGIVTESFINGESVKGDPFLIEDWVNGSVTLENGQKYDGYKLKFNANTQTIFFLNGKESAELDQPVSEFTLMPANKPAMNFVNVKVLNKKEKKPLFVEVLFDYDNCQLLRFFNKKVENYSEKSTSISGSKYLKNIEEYLIFDKETKKISNYKNADNKFKSRFKIS